MKRQQLTLIICGVLLAVCCAVAGWFLFTSVTSKNAAAAAHRQAYDELQRIYQAKVFPNKENIARVNEDQKVLEAWLTAASNLVHKGDLHLEKKTPTSFKQTLQATVRELSNQPGAVQGKIVAPGFNFGFDQYLGQDSLPAAEHVDRLTAQLVTIEKICRELYAANILSLKTVTREVFDIAKSEDGSQSRSESRPSRRRDRSGSSPDRDAAQAAAPTSSYYTKQSFSFEFQARPAAFIDALNKLARVEQFIVVAEVEATKSADPLAAYNAAKSGAGAAASKDGAKAAASDKADTLPGQRVVTDPELEPPLDVKLVIDVYSFEGV